MTQWEKNLEDKYTDHFLLLPSYILLIFPIGKTHLQVRGQGSLIIQSCIASMQTQSRVGKVGQSMWRVKQQLWDWDRKKVLFWNQHTFAVEDKFHLCWKDCISNFPFSLPVDHSFLSFKIKILSPWRVQIFLYFKLLQFRLFFPNQILTFKRMSKGYILWPVLPKWLGRNSIEICWRHLWRFFEMSL